MCFPCFIVQTSGYNTAFAILVIMGVGNQKPRIIDGNHRITAVRRIKQSQDTSPAHLELVRSLEYIPAVVLFSGAGEKTVLHLGQEQNTTTGVHVEDTFMMDAEFIANILKRQDWFEMWRERFIKDKMKDANAAEKFRQANKMTMLMCAHIILHKEQKDALGDTRSASAEVEDVSSVEMNDVVAAKKKKAKEQAKEKTEKNQVLGLFNLAQYEGLADLITLERHHRYKTGLFPRIYLYTAESLRHLIMNACSFRTVFKTDSNRPPTDKGRRMEDVPVEDYVRNCFAALYDIAEAIRAGNGEVWKGVLHTFPGVNRIPVPDPGDDTKSDFATMRKWQWSARWLNAFCMPYLNAMMMAVAFYNRRDLVPMSTVVANPDIKAAFRKLIVNSGDLRDSPHPCLFKKESTTNVQGVMPCISEWLKVWNVPREELEDFDVRQLTEKRKEIPIEIPKETPKRGRAKEKASTQVEQDKELGQSQAASGQDRARAKERMDKDADEEASERDEAGPTPSHLLAAAVQKELARQLRMPGEGAPAARDKERRPTGSPAAPGVVIGAGQPGQMFPLGARPAHGVAPAPGAPAQPRVREPTEVLGITVNFPGRMDSRDPALYTEFVRSSLARTLGRGLSIGDDNKIRTDPLLSQAVSICAPVPSEGSTAYTRNDFLIADMAVFKRTMYSRADKHSDPKVPPLFSTYRATIKNQGLFIIPRVGKTTQVLDDIFRVQKTSGHPARRAKLIFANPPWGIWDRKDDTPLSFKEISEFAACIGRILDDRGVLLLEPGPSVEHAAAWYSALRANGLVAARSCWNAQSITSRPRKLAHQYPPHENTQIFVYYRMNSAAHPDSPGMSCNIGVASIVHEMDLQRQATFVYQRLTGEKSTGEGYRTQSNSLQLLGTFIQMYVVYAYGEVGVYCGIRVVACMQFFGMYSPFRYTEPGDIVVDPFCGVGTTCHAAMMLGRDGIGLDIDPSCMASFKAMHLACYGTEVPVLDMKEMTKTPIGTYFLKSLHRELETERRVETALRLRMRDMVKEGPMTMDHHLLTHLQMRIFRNCGVMALRWCNDRHQFDANSFGQDAFVQARLLCKPPAEDALQKRHNVDTFEGLIAIAAGTKACVDSFGYRTYYMQAANAVVPVTPGIAYEDSYVGSEEPATPSPQPAQEVVPEPAKESGDQEDADESPPFSGEEMAELEELLTPAALAEEEAPGQTEQGPSPEPPAGLAVQLSPERTLAAVSETPASGAVPPGQAQAGPTTVPPTAWAIPPSPAKSMTPHAGPAVVTAGSEPAATTGSADQSGTKTKRQRKKVPTEEEAKPSAVVPTESQTKKKSRKKVDEGEPGDAEGRPRKKPEKTKAVDEEPEEGESRARKRPEQTPVGAEKSEKIKKKKRQNE